MSVAPSPTVRLSAAEVAAYHRDGFVVVPRLYAAPAVAAWKELLRGLMRAEGALDTARETNPGVRVWMAGDLHPDMRRAVGDDRVPPLLRQVVGDDLEFLSAKAVYKSAVIDFGSPWHQDWYYWHGPAKVSVWIALDDATPDNGCLRVIPGSHAALLPHEKVQGDKGFENRIAPAALAGKAVVDVPLERGGAIIFHDLLAHCSYPNHSGRDRWSFISTYRNAAVRDDSTVWPHAWLLSGRSVNGGTPGQP